jgi:hydroxyacylglutathione hydrolase
MYHRQDHTSREYQDDHRFTQEAPVQLEQFFVEGLGHASYLIGADDGGDAFVVDPRRDIEHYVEAAHRLELQIRYVFETHIHNDFVSGARQLATEVGATHVASADANLHFDHHPVRDGDELHVGELLIRVLSTPGHTPEHVCYAVVDTSRDQEPFLVFTGGDLLIGAVGRPDLLGRELGEKLAPRLYDSLYEKILPLGDHVIVLPTHGGGSLCGKGIARTRLSTIGYERRANTALKQPSKAAFVESVLGGNPGIPTYYARMRPTNLEGPELVHEPDARPLTSEDVQHLAGHGAIVLDTRPNVAFGAAHIPGAYNVPMGPMMPTWVGWLVPNDVPIVLVLDREADWHTATTSLLRIGYDRFAGYLQPGMSTWVERALPIEAVEQVPVRELSRRLSERKDVQVLDVRTDAEFSSGHIANAENVMLGDLPKRLDQLGFTPERPVAAVCGSGYRSSIATSLLQQRGFVDVWNVLGGMAAWQEAGLVTTKNGN